MEFKLVVDQRTTADTGRKFTSCKIVCVNQDGDTILVTYDNNTICNILGCSPAKLKSLQVGTHNL